MKIVLRLLLLYNTSNADISVEIEDYLALERSDRSMVEEISEILDFSADECECEILRFYPPLPKISKLMSIFKLIFSLQIIAIN